MLNFKLACRFPSNCFDLCVCRKKLKTLSFHWANMADAFEDETEQTVSLNEYLDEVEDQELVSVFISEDFNYLGDIPSLLKC